MTVSERRNAATFIKHTTVTPFIFMGFTFKCFYCLEYYSEVPQLMTHTSTHKIPDLDAILQKYIPKGKRMLQVDTSQLKCRICDEKYEDLDKIRQHLTGKHEVKFSTASNGMTEYKMAVKDGGFNCHYCYTFFPSFTRLNAHVNSHVGKVVCETCGAGFLNQHLLLKHKELHDSKKFVCEVCDKDFAKRSQLKYHTDIQHKGKLRVKSKKCPKCNEMFKEHYSKIAHLKLIHGESKIFHCHVCKASFSKRRSLTEHVTKSHTEKYKCNTCSKCFSIESKLKQHLKSHSGERSFICHVCNNAYMHKMSLRKHMAAHSDVFRFICAECGSGFQNKIEFSKHMKQWHYEDGG